MLKDKPRILEEVDLNGEVLAQVMDEYQKTVVDPWLAKWCSQHPSGVKLAIREAAKWLRIANHSGGGKGEPK